MKITRIQTSNFLGVRNVDVAIQKPVALFAGKNGAGKSSLQEAIRHALTGETVRVELKKEYGQLLTEGADAGFVTVEWDGGEASLVLPKGERKVAGGEQISSALPYILDAQRFAKMSGNDRRSFLFGFMGVKLNGPAIKEKMLARGCDQKKVEMTAPMLRAGFDAAHKDAQGKARDAKAAWRTITGETYGEKKAEGWKADKPVVDQAKLDNARADLLKVDEDIAAESQKLGSMEASARHVADQAGKVSELREKAGRFARIQEKLNKDEAELAEWEKKVAETREKASGASKKPTTFSCPCCGVVLYHRLADGAAVEYVEPERKADPEAVAALPRYEIALSLLQNSVANDKRDLAAAEVAAKALAELENQTQSETPTDEQIAKQRDIISAMKNRRIGLQSEIGTLGQASIQAKAADEKTTKAAAAHADVQSWDKIADALSPDGIPADLLYEAMSPINERLKASSKEAEWPRVTIDSDMAIYSSFREGNQAQRPYALLSESEKWRVDAMIAEAVSHLAGVKLLVLDRFDVLDLKGREDLLYWLDGMAADGDIDTCLLFGTLKQMPTALPENITAFWIENGVITNERAEKCLLAA